MCPCMTMRTLLLLLLIVQACAFSPLTTIGRVAHPYAASPSLLHSTPTTTVQASHTSATTTTTTPPRLPSVPIPPSIQASLDALYPPTAAAQRNALSRTDGYWPYVQNGQEPPVSLTYGEFDVPSLAAVVQEALLALLQPDNNKHLVFTDIGSGTGRMVLAAAALFPHSFRLCRGVERLPGLHDTAVQCAQTRDAGIDATTGAVDVVAPVQLICGSFEDVAFGADSDIIFCFSTCFSTELLERLAQTIVQQCRPGTIVVTTDYALPTATVATANNKGVSIQQIQERTTECALIDGDCTVYFHRVVVVAAAAETHTTTDT